MINTNKNTKIKRQKRVRAGLLAKVILPRLTVNRSNQNISAQIIDTKGLVLASCTSRTLKNFKGTKVDQAKEVGTQLGKKAIEAKIVSVVFDRGSYRFHGRIKALAEAVRSSGIKF